MPRLTLVIIAAAIFLLGIAGTYLIRAPFPAPEWLDDTPVDQPEVENVGSEGASTGSGGN